MIYRLILFLVINFATIGGGSLLAGKGPRSDWYVNLNKAPWTPPGWVFGASWTIIMICFSIYLASLWPMVEEKKILITILLAHYILNLSWNPLFFQFHQLMAALVVISALTVLIGFLIYFYWAEMQLKSLLLAPYFIWLVIATSLNAYSILKN